MNENNRHNERISKEALMVEIDQIEAELAEIEKKNAEVIEERYYYERKYEAIRQSYLGRFAKQAFPILRMAKQILTGEHKKKLQKKAKKRIHKLKYRLNDLGFERAVTDLHEIIESSFNPYLKKKAAWELAIWYANQYDENGAYRCLELLPIAARWVRDPQFLRKINVMKAECLDRVGENKKARRVISKALESDEHSDLYLAAANLETFLPKRLRWINEALRYHGLSELSLEHSSDKPAYDRLVSASKKTFNYEIGHYDGPLDSEPRITVIIPAYNAEDTLQTSLESILSQTWRNLEVIVVDDRSQDDTARIAVQYVQKDPRVHLIRAETNAGPYVARNLALKRATGEFVTVNDADDWSHPEKIERQVRHLIQHPVVIANTSEQARATENLQFYRRGRPGEYTFANMSSLMFRRKPVMDKLGYWDSVRFGADGEFKRRLKKAFGAAAVVDLKTGPLSFPRQTSDSLTGSRAFGYHGYFMGARKEYFDSYSHYHQKGKSLKYEFPQVTRPFSIPDTMQPIRENPSSGRRHFDVILVSEFRLLGGTNMSNAEEIKVQKKMGLRTGLIQMSRYDFDSQKQINPKIRELIDGQQVQMLVYGEKVSCDLLIVRHPPILQEWQKYIPNVEAREIRVIVNQPPKRDYGKSGGVLYNIPQCVNNLKNYFGDPGIWHPIGPSVRSVLQQYHSDELHSIRLSDENWVNIIDVDEWRRPHPLMREDSKLCIGRHSRPQYTKWPSDSEEILKIYPETDDIDVLILGGAQVPKKILGRIPKNWIIYEFDEIQPKDFLAMLDVFVYYTHPDWVESFGRVIIEAMAVGVPVIIPPTYRPLFGEAAIYAEPEEVQEKIYHLMHSNDYLSQIRKAHDYVEQHFGYTAHTSRLKEILKDKIDVNISI